MSSSPIQVPPIPDTDGLIRTRGRGHLRYPDVSQDGRLVLRALSATVSTVVWVPLVTQHSFYGALRKAGVVPIMGRVVLVGAPARAHVATPLDGEGTVQFAHVADDTGAVTKLVLRMWAWLTARPARDATPSPDDPEAGRVYVEHVFTRPFGPPAQRKVLAFDVPGLPAVPPDRLTWRPAHAVATLPDDAVALCEPTEDAAPVAFGLHHTDSNQHVNSLVYPRLFEDAALRQLAALDRDTAVLARAMEIGYRRPCFAGERTAITVQSYQRDDQLGAIGWFGPRERGNCYLHLVFEP